MNVLAELADFVTTASAPDLPALDRIILRRHTADAVVARLVGQRSSEGRAVAALFPPHEGAGHIAGLAALVRLTEIDDIHLPSCTTPSSVAVPVALACAAQSECSPATLESAIWVSTEIVVRVGKAIDGARVLYKGLWPTRTGATLGAAAAAARVWGLDRDQTQHALSLAAMATAGRTGRFQGEPSGRWIVFAMAVANGIKAAEAARAGVSGDPDLLEGDWLEGALGVPVDTGGLLRDLGRGSIYPELSLKPYCTSRQALSAAEAMQDLVGQGLDPQTIRKIVIRVPSAYAGMVGQKLDSAIRSSSYVSAPGLVAIAALAPDSLYDVDRASVLGDDRIMSLSRLATVVADESLDSLFPQAWPAEIEVETSKGAVRARVVEPTGAPGNRIDDAGLLDKARKVLGHVGARHMAEQVLAAAKGAFDSQAESRALISIFAAGP